MSSPTASSRREVAGAAASTIGSASALEDSWKLAYAQALPELEELSRCV